MAPGNLTPALLLVALSLACSERTTVPPPPEPAASLPAPPPTALAPAPPRLAPSDAMLRAADPRMPGFEGWPLVFDATGHDRPDLERSLDVRRGGEVLRVLEPDVGPDRLAAVWDGRDAEGALVEAGPARVVARVWRRTRGPSEAVSAFLDVDVVRVGIVEVQLAAGDAGHRAPLLYRKTAGVLGGFHEVAADAAPWRMAPDATEPDGATALDLADGTPRTPPAIWDDLLSPPLDPGAPDGIEADAFNLPTAWVAGSPVDVAVTVSFEAAGSPAGGRPRGGTLELLPPEGLVAAGDAHLGEAPQVAFRAAEARPLVPGVGRFDVTWRWTFRYVADDGAAHLLPGHVETTHRLYGLAGEPTFAADGVPHRPWVDVVDLVAGWIGGATAAPDAVAGAIVGGVYDGLGLAYDRASGADAYIRFPGTWNGATVDLSRFQDRVNGSIVNCSDNAGIVSAYANMMGIDVRYQIVRRQFIYGFDLHPTQPIGSSEFLPSPFLSGRASFRFHAITETPLDDPEADPLERLVFDSTLAVDGDEDPTSAPHVEQLVDGLTRQTYLSALSPDWEELTVFVDEKMRIE